MLKDALRSGHHYYMKWESPERPLPESKPYFRRGEIIHTAVLEPERFVSDYVVCAARNTKIGKEEEKAIRAQGKEPITLGEWALAQSIVAAVRNHADASRLLYSGKAEQSFWWDDPDTGLRCKCRPDWLNSAVVDLKTTTDASPRGFAKSVATFRYHVQASHYLAGLGVERFLFIAVEKTYPHPVAVYELNAEALQLGNELRQRDMHVIADCRATGEWPSYSTDVETLSLPKWALNPDSTVLTSDDF